MEHCPKLRVVKYVSTSEAKRSKHIFSTSQFFKITVSFPVPEIMLKYRFNQFNQYWKNISICTLVATSISRYTWRQ